MGGGEAVFVRTPSHGHSSSAHRFQIKMKASATDAVPYHTKKGIIKHLSLSRRPRRCEPAGRGVRQRPPLARRRQAEDRGAGAQRGAALRHLEAAQGVARMRLQDTIEVSDMLCNFLQCIMYYVIVYVNVLQIFKRTPIVPLKMPGCWHAF